MVIPFVVPEISGGVEPNPPQMPLSCQKRQIAIISIYLSGFSFLLALCCKQNGKCQKKHNHIFPQLTQISSWKYFAQQQCIHFLLKNLKIAVTIALEKHDQLRIKDHVLIFICSERCLYNYVYIGSLFSTHDIAMYFATLNKVI